MAAMSAALLCSTPAAVRASSSVTPVFHGFVRSSGQFRQSAQQHAVVSNSSFSRRTSHLQALAMPTVPSEGIGSAYETVGDIMTWRNIIKCTPETTIDEALEMLVKHRITGLPVVDDSGRVVGVVSDYDLLSFENIAGKLKSDGMFPAIGMEWKAFNEIEKLIQKNSGRTVEDVMTPDPLTVRPKTSLEAAARILLEKKVRRLMVVDSDGELLGIFSRSDLIKAAIASRRDAVLEN